MLDDDDKARIAKIAAKEGMHSMKIQRVIQAAYERTQKIEMARNPLGTSALGPNPR